MAFSFATEVVLFVEAIYIVLGVATSIYFKDEIRKGEDVKDPKVKT
jgi:hypothetical protein